MRALQFRTYGGPEVLDGPRRLIPTSGPGQIRIAVRAASVNPIDWKAFSGAMSGGEPMASTGYLGYDAAGVVDEVGEGVSGVAVGDEVFGRGRNTQAEYAVLDSGRPSRPPSTGRWPPRRAWPAKRVNAGFVCWKSRPATPSLSTAAPVVWARPPCRWPSPEARR